MVVHRSTSRHPRTASCRAPIAGVVAAVLAAPLLASCGDDSDAALDTLPPMSTTTTTTTTTTVPDTRKKLYEVQAGDNVNDIAAAFQVLASDIIELNGLPSNGYLQVGQILELPDDVVVYTELPTTTVAP